jgi:hypothetical protein
MKILSYSVLASLLVSAMLFACSEKKVADNKAKVEIKDVEVPLDSQGMWVKYLLQENKGIMRGIDFGTPADSIFKKEKIKKLEEGKNFVVYAFEVDEDIMDIKYEFDSLNKVKAFRVDAFINGRDGFMVDFIKYFDTKYGKKKKVHDSLLLWKSPRGYEIKLITKKINAGVAIDIRYK